MSIVHLYIVLSISAHRAAQREVSKTGWYIPQAGNGWYKVWMQVTDKNLMNSLNGQLQEAPYSQRFDCESFLETVISLTIPWMNTGDGSAFDERGAGHI